MKNAAPYILTVVISFASVHGLLSAATQNAVFETLWNIRRSEASYFIDTSFWRSHWRRKITVCMSEEPVGAKGEIENGNQDTLKVVACTTDDSPIRNFRAVAGLRNVYRCGSTDALARRSGSTRYLSEADRILLYDAGLVVDLRSESERNEDQSKTWMFRAPGGSFDIVRDGRLVYADNDNSQKGKQRTALWIDLLSASRCMSYLEKNWLSPEQKIQVTLCKAFDGQRLDNLRIDILNGKGLAGLYEAILETGKVELFLALCSITEHSERYPDSKIVINCVHGKDRTGLLAMLCQAVIGLSENEIVAEYHKSEHGLGKTTAVATNAAFHQQQTGRLDRRVFGGAPSQAMRSLLEYVKSKYGSVSPGYMDAIGFDESWRSRLSSTLNR